MHANQIAVSVLVWLVNYAAQSAFIFGSVWMVARWLPERFDLISETLWKCALVTSVVAPFLPSPAISNTVSLAFPLGGSLTEVRDIGLASSHISLPIILVSLWVGGTLAGLTRLTLSYRRMMRTLTDRRPLPVSEIDLELAMEPMPYAITWSAAIRIPIAVGREICIPSWALDTLEPEQLRTIVAHEAAHIARHDAAWRWTAAIISRVFFFQPFNHLAARKIRELAECLCDEAAVQRAASPAVLASTLGAVAAVISGPDHRRVALLPSFATRESLTVRRVRRMLSSRVDGRRAQAVLKARRFIATGASGALLALAAVAPNIGSPAAPTIQYVISAEDPAGPFTLTVERGRVIGASISGRTLASSQLKQRGSSLELVDPRAGAFSVTLTPQGGITWTPRRLAPPINTH